MTSVLGNVALKGLVTALAVLAFASTEAAQAAPCENDGWQPTFVHDLDLPDGPWYVTANGQFVHLKITDTQSWTPHACELIAEGGVRDRLGYTTCEDHTRVQCGCGRGISEANRTCASFLWQHTRQYQVELYGISGGNGGNAGNTGNSPSGGGLVVDPEFASFGSPGGPWGINVQYGANGIWWNSGGADTTAGVVTLSGINAATGLYIRNNSGRAPHLFGTTAQRIAVRQGSTYRISFFGMARGLGSNGGVNITIDPQWTIRPISMPAGTYDWRQFEGTFVAPADTIDLRILSEDRGEVWITGMTLELIGSSGSPGGSGGHPGSCQTDTDCPNSVCLLGQCAPAAIL
jgi:hypothetical protein